MTCPHPVTRHILVDGVTSGAAFCPDCGARLTAPCPHPAGRLFVWLARDDGAPGGMALCVGCCACGQVLAGGGRNFERGRNP